MDRDLQPVVDVLKGLIGCTRRLSRCEDDPDADVGALTLECRGLLEKLQSSMPSDLMARIHEKEGTGDSLKEYRQILDMLQALDIETRRCMEVLKRRRDGAGRDLASFRNARKAIHAYRNSI